MNDNEIKEMVLHCEHNTLGNNEPTSEYFDHVFSCVGPNNCLYNYWHRTLSYHKQTALAGISGNKKEDYNDEVKGSDIECAGDTSLGSSQRNTDTEPRLLLKRRDLCGTWDTDETGRKERFICCDCRRKEWEDFEESLDGSQSDDDTISLRSDETLSGSSWEYEATPIYSRQFSMEPRSTKPRLE